MTAIPPPPPSVGDDSHEAAYAALAPPLRVLLLDAIQAGGHPGDVLATTCAVLVEEQREASGATGTIETLRDTVEALKAGRDT